MRTSTLRSSLLLAAWACAVLCASARSALAEDSAHASELQRAKQCFTQGQAAYKRGAFAEARDGFLCAYELAPSPELAWNLGRVYERVGEAAESIRYYQLYLSMAPNDAREHHAVEQRIAALQALLERQRASIRAALPSSAELNQEARTFFERGVKLYARGRYEAALVAFTAALRASGAPELRYNLAVTAERLGQAQDALDHYRAYLAALPEAEDKAEVAARIDALRARAR